MPRAHEHTPAIAFEGILAEPKHCSKYKKEPDGRLFTCRPYCSVPSAPISIRVWGTIR